MKLCVEYVRSHRRVILQNKEEIDNFLQQKKITPDKLQEIINQDLVYRNLKFWTLTKKTVKKTGSRQYQVEYQIKKLLRKKKIKCSDVAQYLNVTKETLSKKLSNNKFSVWELYKISKLLVVTIEELIVNVK